MDWHRKGKEKSSRLSRSSSSKCYSVSVPIIYARNEKVKHTNISTTINNIQSANSELVLVIIQNEPNGYGIYLIHPWAVTRNNIFIFTFFSIRGAYRPEISRFFIMCFVAFVERFFFIWACVYFVSFAWSRSGFCARTHKAFCENMAIVSSPGAPCNTKCSLK